MSALEPRRLPVTPGIYDRGAERVFDAVLATCDPGAGFAVRVEEALRSSLSVLAADPVLTRTLTVSSGLDEDALRRQRHWHLRFAALLDGAAAELDGHPGPDFMGPTLIAGVSHLLAQQVLAGGAEDLKHLLPSLLEFVLVFYLDSEEAARLARAAG